MDKRLLAEFLRSRRESLLPQDVGLIGGSRRRAPGLRREEVAQLAGMSTDYLARLEQQRAPRPSTHIAASLARALRLSTDERDHLFALIGHNAPRTFDTSDHVPPSLLQVLDGLSNVPCLVQNDLLDTLAMNSLAEALFGDETSFTGPSRSGFHRWFMDPGERTIYPVDAHERHGQYLAARLRMATQEGSDPRRARAIAAELGESSAEFRRMWDLHHVAQTYDECDTLLHPELGSITVDAQVLFTEKGSHRLVILNPGAGAENRSKLDLLRVIGHERLSR